MLVILAFEVFAVVQALGGTLFPVLMSETYNCQFELLNGGAAVALAVIFIFAVRKYLFAMWGIANR